MVDDNKEWVLPSSIPFDRLRSKDLEQCVYWLMDAMGAKDLEWRSGGAGDGAADGGRDLTAKFYLPGADGEPEIQNWWIECKGRKGTLDKTAVVEAVNNSQSRTDLDFIVVATNTQFSNPTRDWVQVWQAGRGRPKVKIGLISSGCCPSILTSFAGFSRKH